MRGPTAAAFDMGGRIMAAGIGHVIAAPARLLNVPPRSLVIPKPKPTPAYKHTFNVLLKRPEITDRFDTLILEASQRHGLDPRLVKAVIAAESEFSPQALSPKGARGLMQVLPSTAEELGVPGSKLHDPEHGIRAGTAYLALLYRAAWKKYRLKGVGYKEAPLWVTERIIASYNAGPRALTRNSFVSQTRNYVRKVLLFYGSDVTEFRRAPQLAARPWRARSLPRTDTLP
jgi:soluble lytic murein transglycosylase-like protein